MNFIINLFKKANCLNLKRLLNIAGYSLPFYPQKYPLLIKTISGYLRSSFERVKTPAVYDAIRALLVFGL
jgi:hypothetical protein